MLTIADLTYRIEGRLLFERANLKLPAGVKAGLVGKNGAGKTTLLRLILGEIHPEGGETSVHPKARVGAVAQEAPTGPQSVLEMVLAADKERAALMGEVETATDPHRIAEIHMRLADIDAHSAEGRASAILKGLGFAHDRQSEACQTLSGGWRMRVALAGALFAMPDLLLLDEPTNYLDLEGTLWLKRYLASYPRTVLLISHDRDLLNEAADSIVHLENGQLTFYRGNYDIFERTRRMQMEQALKSRERTLTKIAHMQSYVDRFRYKATKAKQAQSRLKAIAKLRPPEALLNEEAIPFSFPQPRRANAVPMMVLENASVGYGGPPILSRMNLRMDPDDRIALVGINGNGKSTFAKLIAGDLRAIEGRVQRGRGLEVAYFAQHQMEKLVAEKTPLQHVLDFMTDSTDAQRRSRVAQMGLTASRMDTAAGNLSGGEKARLLLGLITFTGPGLLILDEPTNHLDIDSRDALIGALNDYEGAVLVISHDRHLIAATMDRIWVAEDGTIKVFDDDIDAYQRQQLSRVTGSEQRDGRRNGGVATARKRDRQEAAAKRATLSPLRREIKQAEDKTARLRKDLAKIERQLADPGLYAGDPDEAIALGKDKARLGAEIDALEELWLEKSAELETRQAALEDEA